MGLSMPFLIDYEEQPTLNRAETRDRDKVMRVLRDAVTVINNTMPISRPRSIALTKIEEASLWIDSAFLAESEDAENM